MTLNSRSILIKICVLIITIWILIISPQLSSGTCGLIQPDDEPNVKNVQHDIIIAWNGTHEKLIISSGLSVSEVSEDNFAIRVAPLPSHPSIDFTDQQIFDRVENRAESLTFSPKGTGLPNLFTEETDKKREDEKLLSNRVINSKNSTVAKIENFTSFVQLVNKKMSYMGVEEWKVKNKTKEAVNSYLDRGISYYVIDIINIEGEDLRTEPIVYEFVTDKLFCPIRINNITENIYSFDITVFSKRTVNPQEFKRTGISFEVYEKIKRSELNKLGYDIADMFNSETVYFSFYSGKNVEDDVFQTLYLKDDIITDDYTKYPESPNMYKIEAFSAQVIITLIIVFSFYRKKKWFFNKEKEPSIDSKSLGKSIFKNYLPMVIASFFLIPIFFFLFYIAITSGFKNPLLIYLFYSILFFIYISQIIFYFNIYFFRHNYEDTMKNISIYAGVILSFTFAFFIILSVSYFIDPEGIEMGYIISFSGVWRSISFIFWGLSFIPMSFIFLIHIDRPQFDMGFSQLLWSILVIIFGISFETIWFDMFCSFLSGFIILFCASNGMIFWNLFKKF